MTLQGRGSLAPVDPAAGLTVNPGLFCEKLYTASYKMHRENCLVEVGRTSLNDMSVLIVRIGPDLLESGIKRLGKQIGMPFQNWTKHSLRLSDEVTG